MIVFGNTSATFDSDWQSQSFTFSPSVPYGLLQQKGGPCGLLAAVQAHLLRELLFGSSKNDSLEKENSSSLCEEKRFEKGSSNHQNFSKLMQLSAAKRQKALILTLAKILWQAGENREAIIAERSGKQVIDSSIQLRKDGIIETLVLRRFSRLEDLETFFTDQVKQLEFGGSCVCFLYSVVLSRGLDRIKLDMDDPTNCLIGRHGYCTQEMVNLILTGQAVSNIFDNEIVLSNSFGANLNPKKSQLVLRGLSKRSDIGFLSLFEHYNSCQVGMHYKFPRYPVWVVLSESHFTVVFSFQETVATDPPAVIGGKELVVPNKWVPFHLYYYDTLGKQDTEISLFIESPSERGQETKNKDLESPLELCIRTKWRDATITWHGSEPLL